MFGVADGKKGRDANKDAYSKALDYRPEEDILHVSSGRWTIWRLGPFSLVIKWGVWQSFGYFATIYSIFSTVTKLIQVCHGI